MTKKRIYKKKNNIKKSVRKSIRKSIRKSGKIHDNKINILDEIVQMKYENINNNLKKDIKIHEDIEFYKDIENNQIKLISIPDNRLNTFSIYFVVKIGSRHENKDELGYSHILEHMLFKGTKKYPKYQEILYKLKQMGVVSNAYTTPECTVYHYTYIPIHSNNNDIDKLTYFVISLTFDMLFNSLILKSEFEKERNVVLQEYYDDRDEDQGSRINKLYDILYGDNPINQKPIGKEDIIKNATNNKIMKYYEKHYKYDNIFFMASGNIPKNLIKILSNSINHYIYNTNNKINNKNLEKIDVSNIIKSLPNISNIEIPNKEIHYINSINNQNSLYLIFPIENGYNNTELFELNLLMRILAGNMAGRLNFAIRENRGLVYSISTDRDLFENTGFFYINTQNIPENSGEIINIILKELENIKKNGITQDELNGVANSYTDLLLMSANDVSFPIELYLDDILYNYLPIRDIKSRIDKIHSITVNQLNDFIYRYLNFDNLLVICVGNDIRKNDINNSMKKHNLHFKQINNK